MPSRIAVRWAIGFALRRLRKLHVPFRGPFTTPKKNRIYLVDEWLLTEQEIMALHACANLVAENGRLQLDVKCVQRRDIGGTQ